MIVVPKTICLDKVSPICRVKLWRVKRNKRENDTKKAARRGGFLCICARTWDRTKDLTSISRVLYQLSYTRVWQYIIKKVIIFPCLKAR